MICIRFIINIHYKISSGFGTICYPKFRTGSTIYIVGFEEYFSPHTYIRIMQICIFFSRIIYLYFLYKLCAFYSSIGYPKPLLCTIIRIVLGTLIARGTEYCLFFVDLIETFRITVTNHIGICKHKSSFRGTIRHPCFVSCLICISRE